MKGGREGRRHARVQGRRARFARRDDGHRGRRRRAERDVDGRRERRAHGLGTAAPAARPRRPRARRLRACVLLYKPPLSELARERLGVLRETNDGFAVAQKDLELRGPGEVLGTRQTGVMQLRVADLLRDADLLPQVIEISERAARDGAGPRRPADSPLDPRRGRVCKGVKRVCRPGAAAPRIAAMRHFRKPELERSVRHEPRAAPACRGRAMRRRCCSTTRAIGASCACIGRSASGCCCGRRCGRCGSPRPAGPTRRCS